MIPVVCENLCWCNDIFVVRMNHIDMTLYRSLNFFYLSGEGAWLLVEAINLIFIYLQVGCRLLTNNVWRLNIIMGRFGANYHLW